MLMCQVHCKGGQREQSTKENSCHFISIINIMISIIDFTDSMLMYQPNEVLISVLYLVIHC